MTWRALAVATAVLVSSIPAVNARAGAGVNPFIELGKAQRAYDQDDYRLALEAARKIPAGTLRNDDYRIYLLAQSRFATGDYRGAETAFRILAKRGASRFSATSAWRIADCLWAQKKWAASSERYRKLSRGAGKKPRGDIALARFRVALASERAGKKKRAAEGYRDFLTRYPLHPHALDAETRFVRLSARSLSNSERLARARVMKANKDWHEAVAELEKIPDDAGTSLIRQRDYWTAMTLFSMRRQYKRAGDMLLGLYKSLGGEAARAMFHGARALSRADFDKQAIVQYKRVVETYPRSKWAIEAQYLAGWLEFNMGNYRAGLPALTKTIEKYPRSRWARLARWYVGMSHFLLGEYAAALPHFETLGKRSGRLDGGKGRYWAARTKELLGETDDAQRRYRAVMGRHPFSWYALLAQARLKKAGATIGPFGDRPRSSSAVPAVEAAVDEALATDPLIRRADELTAAGMPIAAGYELRRQERAFIKRHPRAKALAMLMDRYRKAGNFNRPWMLGVVHGGSRALDAPPKGKARVWWEHAYPLAYRTLVDKHRPQGKSPTYWLYSIMRKESGFNPHVHSYADARGLLQMIPATTKRVSAALGIDYTPDLLFDPEKNIQTGSWYIGRLFHKFRGQVPMAAGSFNSGPRPVMRWLDQFGKRPTDVFVELCSYTQTREYMKKVTETYARYLYLYDGVVYQQPLTVRQDYAKDALTY